VVAFMAEASKDPVNTYAIGFEGGAASASTTNFPTRVAWPNDSTNHKEIVVTPDVVGLLPKLLWHMDEPIADTAFITTWLVSEFARKDVTVILSGVGGDELFGGYRRYLGNHYLSKFDSLPRWTRRLAGRAARVLPADRHSKWLNTLRLAKGFLAAADLSFEERYRSYVAILPRPDVARMLRNPSGGSCSTRCRPRSPRPAATTR
jgi:asparagine synthase (glutamine-hydrolysing)